MRTRLARARRFDPAWIAAMAAIGYGLGPGSAYRGVRAIAQDEALRWDGRHLHRVRLGRRIAPARRGLLSNPQAFAADLERAIAAATKAVRLAAQGPGRDRAGRHGGRDAGARVLAARHQHRAPAVRAAIVAAIAGTRSELWSVERRDRLAARLQQGPLDSLELASLLGVLPMLSSSPPAPHRRLLTAGPAGPGN